MAKLKGYKKLNKAITAPLKQFGIKKAVCGKSYSYLFNKEKIIFQLTIGIEDEWFNTFVKKRFDYKIEYPFVISLLHEVGHHLNNEDIDGEVYAFCLSEKARIDREMLSASKKRQKELEFQYFSLPDEIMATAWAINYAKKHPKKIKKMWRKMQPAILEFYAKNNITDD